MNLGILAQGLALSMAASPKVAPEPPAGWEPGESYYVDASLEPSGQLLGWKAVSGLPGTVAPVHRDLILAVRTPAGRELRLHAIRKEGIDPKPRVTVPMLDDVIAWGVGDLRSAEGSELLLLTRGGGWSYSILKDGYRDNAVAIARTELVYDLPNPASLPYWAFVLPGPKGQGQDRFLLPGRDGYALWAPDPADPTLWKSGPRFAAGRRQSVRSDGEDLSMDGGSSGGGSRVEIVLSGDRTPFMGKDDDNAANLLSESLAYRAPALLDVNGDGSLDLLAWTPEGLAMHPAGALQASRVEALPDYLTPKDTERLLQLADLDGDGDLDILARLSAKGGGLENNAVRLLVLLQDKGRMFPEKPDQVMRFEAAELRSQITDVNADGKPDLVVRKFELPSMLESVGGLNFTFTHLVYFGERRGFERKPSVKSTEVYDEDSVSGAIANYELVRDCDGDGYADLAALDLSGRLAVRRVAKDSGFFSGDSWELEEAPWKLFDTRGEISSLSVPDLNGDGLGDLVSLGESRLTVMLSMRRRNR